MPPNYLFCVTFCLLIQFCPGFDLTSWTFVSRSVEPAGEFHFSTETKRIQSGITCGNNLCLGPAYCCPGQGKCYNPASEACCADGSICQNCRNRLGQCCSANVSSCPSESHQDRKFCSSNGCIEGYRCGAKSCMNKENCCQPTRRLGVPACYDQVNEICCASGQSCSSNKCLHIPPDGQCCSVTNEVYRFCPNPHGNTNLNKCNPDGSETCVSSETASTSTTDSNSSDSNKKAILMGVLLSVGVAFCFLFLVASFRMRYLYGSDQEVPQTDEETGKDETELAVFDPPKYEELETTSSQPPPFESAPPPYVPNGELATEKEHSHDDPTDQPSSEQQPLVDRQ